MSPPEVRRAGPEASSPEVRSATDRTSTESDLTPGRPQDGLDRAIENAASDWWFQGALVAIKQLATSGRGFTVENLSGMVGEPPDPHYWGALFAAAQKLRIIEPVGARLGRDGRLVRVWWGLPT
jgi:hypothetical protein